MTQPQIRTRDVADELGGSLTKTAQQLEAIVQTFEKASALEKEAQSEAREASERADRSDSDKARAAAAKARKRLQLISDIRRQAGLERRAAKALYQEQKRLMAAQERREQARNEALASFERQWERDYEQKISEPKRNIELLRRWLKT